MSEIKFNLGAGNLEFATDDDLAEALAKSGGKYFDTPCNIDLKIVAADFHKNKTTGDIFCKGDSTWFNVVLTLQGPEDKELRHWMQVPTSKLTYGVKDTLAVFRKLQEFFFAIGEEITLATVGKLVEKYFTDPGVLVGTVVNADLGYEGPYVEKAKGSDNYVIVSGGKPLTEDGVVIEMPDRASAITFAKGRNLVPSFISVLKLNSGKRRPKAKATAPAKAPAAKAAVTDEEW